MNEGGGDGSMKRVREREGEEKESRKGGMEPIQVVREGDKGKVV